MFHLFTIYESRPLKKTQRALAPHKYVRERTLLYTVQFNGSMIGE